MMVCGLVLLLASVIVAEESHDRYFKEDHYTGADYLRLAGDGSYEVIGREHMGVWVIDKGVWVSSGGELRFNSTKRKSSSFTAREATFRKLNFLVFRGSAAPGIEMAESDIRADLEKAPGALPPYVFFEVGLRLFACETGQTYRFKFYPEMNGPNVCGETK